MDLDITFRQCLPSGEVATRYSRVFMVFSNWSHANDRPVDFFYVDFKGSWSRPSKNY